MAQVEIVVTEPTRVVALVTRDAVEELGPKPGMSATALVKSTSVMVEKVKLLAIFAAASLTGVFPLIDKAPRYQFAGSDQLAFQILQGAPADVFAAASPKLPRAALRAGQVLQAGGLRDEHGRARRPLPARTPLASTPSTTCDATGSSS